MIDKHSIPLFVEFQLFFQPKPIRIRRLNYILAWQPDLEFSNNIPFVFNLIALMCCHACDQRRERYSAYAYLITTIRDFGIIIE